jgi:hypothetical protein
LLVVRTVSFLGMLCLGWTAGRTLVSSTQSLSFHFHFLLRMFRPHNLYRRVSCAAWFCSCRTVAIPAMALGSGGYKQAGHSCCRIRTTWRSKINLPIMIGRTRDRRTGLVPHLLTSGLIPSLLVYLS